MADTRTQIRKLRDEYERNPGSRVFVHLAEAHRKAGEFRQAQKVLTEGLRRHADYPSGLVVLARVHADQGDAERAAAVWRDVVRLDPENVVALKALADIAESAGRRDEALELYRQVMRLENGEPDGDVPFAAPSFEEEDAPLVPAPEPAPERAATPKSRFSWLVRSVSRAAPEPEPVRPAFARDEAPARAVAAMDSPAIADLVAPTREEAPVEVEPPSAEPSAEIQPPSEEQPVAALAEAEPALADAELEVLHAESPDRVADEPAVIVPDDEMEPAVPIRESEEEPSAGAPEVDAQPFEGILPVDDVEPFDGILGGAELDELERIVPANAPALSVDGDAEPDEAESPDETEIDREDIESQEEIVAAWPGGRSTAFEHPRADALEQNVAPGDEEAITTQEELIAAALYDEEAPDEAPAVAEPRIEEAAELPAGPAIRFDELAQLAYEGGAVIEPAHAPRPDPFAHLRAELYGAQTAESEELAGAPAALAEVLVRLLERDGSVMRSESSLRRLLVVALGSELGLGAVQQEALGLAAVLGGLGELSEPDATEPGRQLAVTLQLLSGVALPEAAREALAHQCERWDGAGFPAGLREEAIPFPARVLAVARAAAALLGARGASAGAVVDELQRQAGSAFDPLVVSVLRRVFAQRERHGIGYGWGGRIAVVHPRELRALELASRLHGEGYQADSAGTAAEVRARLSSGALQALVIGADLPDADAAALVREVRASTALLPVLVVDASDARRRVELLGAGADVCFPPDAEFLEVRATLDALLRRGESV